MIILASDLDGTLLFNDVPGQVKKEDIEAIKKFQNNGNLFGVCTGRPIGDVKIDAIDIDFYVVSSGAVVLDKNRQVISEELIDEDIVFAIYNKYIDQVYVCVHGDGKLYNTKDGRFNLNTTRVDAVEQLKGHHLYGLSIDALDEKRAKEITDEINEQFGNYVDAYQNIDCVDIAKKGCSKGSGLKIIKEKMNLNEICGIGDSFNDLPMLKYVDKAFTFNSSNQQVKDHADYLVDSLNEAINLLMK